MIYPKANPQQWAHKYSLPLERDYCRKCQKIVEINIPVICKDFVGFESQSHEPCGESYVISILKPHSQEMKNLLKDL